MNINHIQKILSKDCTWMCGHKVNKRLSIYKNHWHKCFHKKNPRLPKQLKQEMGQLTRQRHYLNPRNKFARYIHAMRRGPPLRWGQKTVPTGTCCSDSDLGACKWFIPEGVPQPLWHTVVSGSGCKIYRHEIKTFHRSAKLYANYTNISSSRILNVIIVKGNKRNSMNMRTLHIVMKIVNAKWIVSHVKRHYSGMKFMRYSLYRLTDILAAFLINQTVMVLQLC